MCANGTTRACHQLAFGTTEETRYDNLSFKSRGRRWDGQVAQPQDRGWVVDVARDPYLSCG